MQFAAIGAVSVTAVICAAYLAVYRPGPLLLPLCLLGIALIGICLCGAPDKRRGEDGRKG